MRIQVVLSIALAVLVAAIPAAQQPAQAPTFKAATQVVELDVRVFDKDGKFLTGLTPADFEVIEDGAAQKVQTFFFVDDPGRASIGASTVPSSAPPSPAPPGPRPRQTWIFFFDLNHLTPGGGYDRARKAVEDFVRDRFQDGDLGGVLAGDKMINNRLTSVRQELLDAVKQVKPSGDARSRMTELTREWPRLLDEEEAVRIARNEREPLQRAVGRACSDDPDACRAAPPDMQVRAKAQRLQQMIHLASGQTMMALNGLASGLAKMPGPKTLVFLSDGFVTQDIETTLRTVVGQTGRAGARIYAIDVRGLSRGSNAGIIDQAQAEDSFGPAAKFDSVADGPNSLAVDTGGLMIRNENNIGRALETIAGDANRYYVLGFQPANTTWDGKFRAVQVRVKRDGVRVRARKGYLALEPARMTLPQPIASPAKDPETAAPRPPAEVAAATEPPTALAALPATIAPVPVAPAAANVPTAPAAPEAGAPAIRVRPDADRLVKELSADDSASADAHAAEGWSAYQRGDLEAAVGPLTTAAAQPGVRPWVLYALGLTQSGLERPREALATWERLRAAAPTFERVYLDLAATHASLADLTSALAVLRAAEVRWPNDPEIHNAIGVVHFRRGALDDAIGALTRATVVAPDDPLAHLNLGRAYELRFTRSQRYVTSQRRWIANESDRRKGAEHYQAYIKIGGPFVNAATEGLQRLEWSK